MPVSTEHFDNYMRRTYRLARSEFAPSYDWIFIQLDGRQKKIGEAGVVQAGVFNQVMSMANSVQEAGNIIIKILKGQVGQQQAVTPQAPAPENWDFGQQQQQIMQPVQQQPMHQPQPQYQAPQAPQFYQPDTPQPQPQPYATEEELAAMQQHQHMDAPMSQLLGHPSQVIPPNPGDPMYQQAMQQAQMPPQQLQQQPGMDPGPHMPQHAPQIPDNLQPPAGVQGEVFPLVDEGPPLDGEAPF